MTAKPEHPRRVAWSDQEATENGLVDPRRVRNLGIAAGVSGHTLWTSAAPAMMYRLYAETWGLSHLTTAGIFAVYPIVVVITLVAAGDLSDHLGRKRTMLIALAASLVGALFMAAAIDVAWLFVGRAFMGIGVGLSAGPSTAAVLEYSGQGRQKLAAAITIGSQAVGFTAAVVLGGVLTQYAPLPLHLSLLLLSGLLIMLMASVCLLPDDRRANAGEWKPRLPLIPPSIRDEFWLGSSALVLAFMFGVLILSFGGQVEHDLIGSANAAINGIALAVFPVTFGVVAILGKAVAARRAITAGSMCSIASMAALVVSTTWQSLPINLGAIFLGGTGYSLLFVGGLEVVCAVAPATQRGGVLSALYLFGYVSMSLVAIALGAVATSYGLTAAIWIGAGIISSGAMLVAFFSSRRRRASGKARLRESRQRAT